MSNEVSAPDTTPEDSAPRRNFLVEFWAIVTGGLAGIVPLVSGLVVLLDPLKRSSGAKAADLIRIAALDAVPADGVPRQFAVVKDKVDAWTYSPNERVGAVFLVRQAESETIEAFNCVCPHAGCFIGYDASQQQFQCPCHTSAFSLDGSIIRPSPSPRGMDRLEPVEVRDGWVYVAFANFKIGQHEKIIK